MKRLDACLKLTLPRALEARILDYLLQHPQWVGPFITLQVEGHGDPDRIESPAEQVRGRAERVQIEILMDTNHVDDLLRELRAELPSGDVVWRLSPVTAAGTLA
jgi:Protein of unknown function (DUF3240)